MVLAHLFVPGVTMNVYILMDIQWDREVDGEIQNVDLPASMNVEAEDPDSAIDVASDQLGFCILSAHVKEA